MFNVTLTMETTHMRHENVPVPQSPESPPLAPHDPPDPAPQAAAWHRAMRVVGCAPVPTGRLGIVNVYLSRTNRYRG
jgi:hypothetical protein